MVPILHLPRNYWKLLGIEMLYVKDNLCAIDKYLKNDEKFKYFSLKYNMTSKSVKFFFLFLNLYGKVHCLSEYIRIIWVLLPFFVF